MLTELDRNRMRGLHPDLFQVVTALGLFCPRPFVVVEGVRSTAQHAKNVFSGASRTLRSRHLTGHAVDLCPLQGGLPCWEWEACHTLSWHVKGAAQLCGVRIEWGGDWLQFADGQHWQLPWDKYPEHGPAAGPELATAEA